MKNTKNFKGNSNYKGKPNHGRKNYGGKASTKGGSKRDFKDKSPDLEYERDSKKVGANELEWYPSSNPIIRDAATLAFAEYAGQPMQWFASPESSALNKHSWPGIMRIGYVPGTGVCKEESDTVNVMAKNIYAYNRYWNSGARNYDAPDYMVAILAIDNLFSMYAHLVRAYGSIQYFNARNRYVSKPMLEALGFDSNNIYNEAASFRGAINALAKRMNTFILPGSMPIFKRHYWMNSNIYKDSESDKAQMYVFVPEIFYTYEEMDLGSRKGGYLKAHQITRQPHTWQEWVGYLDTMIGKLIASEDIGIMIGDTLKGWKGNIFGVGPIADDFVLSPIHNMEVLVQIQNLTAAGNIYDIESCNLKQDVDTNLLSWQPLFTGSGLDGSEPKYAAQGKKNFTIPMFDAEPAAIVEATRLTTLFTEGTVDDEHPEDCAFVPATCGTEIVTRCDIYQYLADEQTGSWDFTEVIPVGCPGRNLCFSNTITDVASYRTMLQYLASLSAFDWHPEAIIYSGSYRYNDMTGFENDSAQREGIMDVDNYTIITEETLRKIHSGAIICLFDFPLGQI